MHQLCQTGILIAVHTLESIVVAKCREHCVIHMYPVCKQALEDLHKDYVLVSADKAGNNIITICKQYYKEVLTKELTSTSTYMHIPTDL